METLPQMRANILWMTRLKGRNSRFGKYLLPIALCGICLVQTASATDYTWLLTATGTWTDSANWAGTPAPVQGTGPTAADNILNATATPGVLRLKGNRSINSLSYSLGGSWTVEANTGTDILTAGTLQNSGAGSIGFRSNSLTATLGIAATNVVLSGGIMNLGTTSGTLNALSSLAVSGTSQVSSGTLTVSVGYTSGTYSLGLLNVNGGLVRLNNGGVSGKNMTVNVLGLNGSGGTVNNNGAAADTSSNIVITNTSDYSTATVLADSSLGTLLVTKNGTGYQALTGGSTYSGGTVINAGTLYANYTGSTASSTGVGNVTVGASGTLGGNGLIAPSAGNSITVNGALAPGFLSSAETLTLALSGTSKLNLGSGSKMAFDLGTASDKISFVTVGDWLTGSGNLTLNLTLGSGFSYDASYVIFENVSTTGFTLAGITGYDSANYQAQFAQVGNNYLLTFSVPEPSTYALLGLAAVLVAGQAARRRRAPVSAPR